jgi:hypothetical protein
MTSAQQQESNKHRSWLGRFVSWLFGPLFHQIPTAFEEEVPSDIKTFEAEVDEAQHDVQEVPAPSNVRWRRSKPARRK